MNNLFKATILAYNKNMLAELVANNIYKFMTDFDTNNSTDMMLVQFKDANQSDIDKFVDFFRRADNQYVFKDEFYYKHELIEKVSPYCKEMCISVAPKMPKNDGDFIDIKKDYGYLTIATMITPSYSALDSSAITKLRMEALADTKVTKESAKQHLMDLGIINSAGEVADSYKEYIQKS